MERAWATVFEQDKLIQPLVCEYAVVLPPFDTLQFTVPKAAKLLDLWAWHASKYSCSLAQRSILGYADRSYAAMHPELEGLKFRSDAPISQQT